MATKQRNILMDRVVNPAILPGLQCYTGTVKNVDNTQTVTLVIDAKSVITAFGITDTGAGAGAIQIPAVTTSGDRHTFVFTSAADNTNLQYFIYTSVTLDDVGPITIADATSVTIENSI